MRYLFILSIVILAGCDYGSFDKDKRQIMAKDYVEWHLPPHSTDFNVTTFREDTLRNLPDSNFKEALGSTLDYHFTDSTHQVQQKRMTVLFAIEGHSIISAISQP